MLLIDNAIQNNLQQQYAAAAKRLLLLDYDGCLVPFTDLPAYAVPDNELIYILKQLTSSPQNDVYIISGRDSLTLENWLGHLPIGLIAEHGARLRRKGSIWQTSTASAATAWMPEIEQIMNDHTLSCPGSFIEKKEFSIAWHYRNANEQIGIDIANMLYQQLQQKMATHAIVVLNGHKVIEVKNKGYNKGTAAIALTEDISYGFILAIGDDRTDEDMFAILADTKNAVTIKIGDTDTAARYRLREVQTLREFLRTLCVI